MRVACSYHSATPPAARRPTAVAVICSTPSRAPTSVPTTQQARWCSTSTTPTTHRAPTTHAGCARWRRRGTVWRFRSARVNAFEPFLWREPAHARAPSDKTSACRGLRSAGWSLQLAIVESSIAHAFGHHQTLGYAEGQLDRD